MVATLTISLPTEGAGGELAVRHRDREVVIDMNAAEPSELAYAAFYADCPHETRPVRAGHRLSLVYNLCVLPGNTDAHRQAPDYAAEVEAVADHLIAWRDNGVTDKLVWVLQHDYSTAGLSFTTLKNADDAVARVLDAAAVRADCSLYAAIVRIEEKGDATYRGGDHVESWHWRESDVNDMVIDQLYVSRHWLDGWIGSDGTRPTFAEIPLLAQELLPARALDDAEPDERRLHEASGNEGVSLERSYRRAAVVIWPRSRTLDIIASAGIDGAVEWVVAQFATDGATSRDHVFALAKRLVRIWSHDPYGREEDATKSRVRMLDLLAQARDRDLTLLFLREVALSHYSGGENQRLLAALAAVGPETSRQYLPDFLDAHFVRLPDQTLALLRKVEEAAKVASRNTLAACVGQAVRALPEVLDVKRRRFEWSQSERRMMIGVSGIRDLIALAWRCGSTEDALTAASLAAEHAQALSPDRAIPAVLDGLRSEAGLRIPRPTRHSGATPWTPCWHAVRHHRTHRRTGRLPSTSTAPANCAPSFANSARIPSPAPSVSRYARTCANTCTTGSTRTLSTSSTRPSGAADPIRWFAPRTEPATSGGLPNMRRMLRVCGRWQRRSPAGNGRTHSRHRLPDCATPFSQEVDDAARTNAGTRSTQHAFLGAPTRELTRSCRATCIPLLGIRYNRRCDSQFPVQGHGASRRRFPRRSLHRHRAGSAAKAGTTRRGGHVGLPARSAGQPT